MSKNTLKRAMAARRTEFRQHKSEPYRPLQDEENALHKSTPVTDEQLVRFVAVMIVGPAPHPIQLALVRNMLKNEKVKESWIARHAELNRLASSHK